MDLKKQNTDNINKKKKKLKPPSKLARDRNRLLKYLEVKFNIRISKDQFKMNDTIVPVDQKPSIPEKKTTETGTQTVETTISNNNSSNSNSSSNNYVAPKVDPQHQTARIQPRQGCAINPGKLYEEIERNAAIRRLEEVPTLAASMRHTVRHLCKKGDSICYKTQEAIDRMQIKTAGLPTEPLKLWDVITDAYKRRDEEISLNQIYEDLVKVHGRRAFDPGKTGSDCFYKSYSP